MKILLCLTFFVLSVSAFAQTQAPGRISLAPDEVALIGYGSLMNQQSMSSTLGRNYEGPVLPIHLSGFRRLYNVAIPNSSFFEIKNGRKHVPELIAYLNVMPTQNKSDKVNAMLFIIKKHELQGFDQRESIYDRKLVNNHQLKDVAIDGPVYVYVGKKENLVQDGDPRVIVRDTYMKIVEKGLRAQPKSFAREYYETTVPPRHKIANDVFMGRPLRCEFVFVF